MKVDTIMKHSEQCVLQNVSNGNRVVMINKIYREKWLNVPVHKATVRRYKCYIQAWRPYRRNGI